MDQFHEIQHIVSRFVQHKITMDETFIVSSIIDKLPSSWKETKRSLKHKKEDMSMEDLANHLRIEQEFCMQEEPKDHGANVPKVHMMEQGDPPKLPKSKAKSGAL